MSKLFLLAGEPSGDRIAAALMAHLRPERSVEISGVGGQAMEQEGLKSLFPMEDLAVMGYADVIARLPLLLWRARQVVQTILRENPDVVVLVDAQVFSQVVAGRLRKLGFSKPILLYVAPAVWAWKPERAEKIAHLYNEVLAILPFEPKVMGELNGPRASYVGHPALEHFPTRPSQLQRGPLMLLPGSRSGELRRHLPFMKDVAEALAGHPAVTGIVLPTPRKLHDHVARATSSWEVPIEVISDETERSAALETAIAAFAVSGTVTLELALSGVPHAVTYIGEGAQVRLYKRALIRHIGLPNIIAGREIVPELLFAGKGDAPSALATLKRVIEDKVERDRQLSGFATMRAMMEQGLPEAPMQSPSARVLTYLPE